MSGQPGEVNDRTALATEIKAFVEACELYRYMHNDSELVHAVRLLRATIRCEDLRGRSPETIRREDLRKHSRRT